MVNAASNERMEVGLAYGAGMGLAVLLLVGIPSGVIANPFFVRPLEARPTDYRLPGS